MHSFSSADRSATNRAASVFSGGSEDGSIREGQQRHIGAYRCGAHNELCIGE
jgi:hypothetical protein